MLALNLTQYKLEATRADGSLLYLEGGALTSQEMWRAYVLWLEKNVYNDIIAVKQVL